MEASGATSLIYKLWPDMKIQTTNVGGAVYPADKQFLEQIKEKAMEKNDLMVCAYPKSGTTWVKEIASVLSRNGDISQSSVDPVEQRVPHLEAQHNKIFKYEGGTQRVFGSHLTPELLPDQVWQKSVKIILVLRNPKAVLVSGYHFHQHLPITLGPFRGTWQDYFNYWVGDDIYYGSWFTWVERWWPYLQRGNIHVVTYEQLSHDLEGTIGNISTFLDKSLSKSVIAGIAQHVKFASMKDNPMTNMSSLRICDTIIQRKGQVDDWKNHFTVAQNELFDAVYEKRIKHHTELANFLKDKLFQ